MCLFNFNLLQEETVLPYYKQKAGIACHKECKAKWEENTARPLNSSQTAVPAGIPKHQPCPLCERGGPPVARKVVGVLYQIVVLIGRLGRDPRGDSCPLTWCPAQAHVTPSPLGAVTGFWGPHGLSSFSEASRMTWWPLIWSGAERAKSRWQGRVLSPAVTCERFWWSILRCESKGWVGTEWWNQGNADGIWSQWEPLGAQGPSLEVGLLGKQRAPGGIVSLMWNGLSPWAMDPKPQPGSIFMHATDSVCTSPPYHLHST